MMNEWQILTKRLHRFWNLVSIAASRYR